MIDHRRLQRALFCLQLDPERARAVFSGERAAADALGLGAEELELLLAVDLAGVSADRASKRREQVLGNLASEFELSLTRAERIGSDAGLLVDFISAPGGLESILDDERLPLSFARHAKTRAERSRDPSLEPLVRLESALVIARRELAPISAPRAGEIARSPRAHLVQLPLGTHDHAARLRTWLDRDGGAPPAAPEVPSQEESLLLLREAAPAPHRLPDVSVEPLEPVVAELLQLASNSLGPDALAAFARRQGAETEELEAFVAELVAEGLLERG